MNYSASNPFDDGRSSSFDASAKEEELRRKEEELNRREKDIEDRRKELKKSGKLGKRVNWPICKPLIYHNIDEEMPNVTLRRLVKVAYAQWIFAVVCLIFNVAALLAILIGNSGTKEIGDFILSIVYFFILFPSWFIIYRLLYRASRKQKPSLFAAFMCLYFLEIVAFCGIAVGVKGTGSAGFLQMIEAFRDINTATGVVVLICAAFWCISAVWSIYIFVMTRIQYSSAGGYQKARSEFGSAAASEAVKHPDLMVQGAKMGANAYASTV